MSTKVTLTSAAVAAHGYAAAELLRRHNAERFIANRERDIASWMEPRERFLPWLKPKVMSREQAAKECDEYWAIAYAVQKSMAEDTEDELRKLADFAKMTEPSVTLTLPMSLAKWIVQAASGVVING